MHVCGYTELFPTAADSVLTYFNFNKCLPSFIFNPQKTAKNVTWMGRLSAISREGSLSCFNS